MNVVQIHAFGVAVLLDALPNLTHLLLRALTDLRRVILRRLDIPLHQQLQPLAIPSHPTLVHSKPMTVKTRRLQQPHHRPERQRIIHRHHELKVSKVSRTHRSRKLTRHTRRLPVRRSQRRVIQTVAHRVVQSVEEHRVRDPLHRDFPHLIRVVKAKTRALDLTLHQVSLAQSVPGDRGRLPARFAGGHDDAAAAAARTSNVASLASMRTCGAPGRERGTRASARESTSARRSLARRRVTTSRVSNARGRRRQHTPREALTARVRDATATLAATRVVIE